MLETVRSAMYISFPFKLRSVNFFSKYCCDVSLCSVVVISIQYSSFEVTFWTVRTLEFQIKWCSVIVNVLISLFCLIIFFQADKMALTRFIHWMSCPCLRYSNMPKVLHYQAVYFLRHTTRDTWNVCLQTYKNNRTC